MKYSIITPAYNIGAWLPATIESILSQTGNFSIEYIVIVNDSPDNTVAIAKQYKEKLDAGAIKTGCASVSMQVVESGEPAGAHTAINQGLERATGDILTWIGGDDLYEPGALDAMMKAFAARPDIAWLKGITSTINENGALVKRGYCQTYRRDWLRMGVYGMEAYHVEQDSVFWRRSLWEKVGPAPAELRYANDYWFWMNMAKYAPLMSMNVLTSCFRKRAGQTSKVDAGRITEHKWKARGRRPLGAWIPRLFFWPYFHSSRSVQKILEELYPFLFPFTPRPYLAIENGTVVEKNMKTFYVD
jgi:glycosyltransferase involved in cell wall biosynthesis